MPCSTPQQITDLRGSVSPSVSRSWLEPAGFSPSEPKRHSRPVRHGGLLGLGELRKKVPRPVPGRALSVFLLVHGEKRGLYTRD